jgi:hypothetical protein
MDAKTIIADITAVTKKWTNQRKSEERKASAEARRATLYRYPRNYYYATEAAAEVMAEAYLKVSDNGRLPAHARQIMYAARGPIQEKTGEPLNDKYFTQTLLPDFMNKHPRLTASWDVVYDARGHFREPHTGVTVPLGTLQVRQYLTGRREDAPISVQGLFPTQCFEDRYGAVLFIEKEGFFPLFRRVRLAERYDLAIMSTKGMSVVAARRLVDHLCGARGIPLFVLHDFDKAGFSIFGTLRLNNRRYVFEHNIHAIDVGLRLQDVQECGLAPEEVHVRDTGKARRTLQRNGATPVEIDFLMSGQRVELNAFLSRPFVNWIESALKQHGVKKVIPDEDVLTEAYRKAFVRQFVRAAIPGLLAQGRTQLTAAGVPEDLRAQVEEMVGKKLEEPWDHAVIRLARKAVQAL